MKKISTKACQACGTIFEKKISCSKREWENTVRYCSRSCVNKGKIPHNKGLPMAEEQKQHLRTVLKGRRCNTGRTHIKKGQQLSPATQFKKGNKPWHAGKPNPYFAGPNNPNWKGGIYPEHLKIRHSVEMKRWRLKVFERDNYACVVCGRKRKKGDRVILHADHYPQTFAGLLKKLKLVTFEAAKKCKKFWDPSLGRTLCSECHLKTDTHGVNLG